MTAISRDKIALVVFALLLILGMSALIGYIQLGHSWNVAATNIDDATGSMRGYTTILYEGTVLPGAALIDDEDDTEVISIPDQGLGIHSEGAQKNQKDVKQSSDSKDKNELGVEEIAAKAQAQALLEELLNMNGTVNNLDEAANSKDLIPEDPLFGLDVDEPLGLFEGYKGKGSTGKNAPLLDIERVEAKYREKKSNVITLDTLEPKKYSEGMIIRKGNTRIGVFSVDQSTTRAKMEQQILSLINYEVDFVLAITPSKKLVEKMNGIDIVISTRNEKIFIMGETVRSTFYVAAPTKGSVGAILISPSNVVTAKVLTEN